MPAEVVSARVQLRMAQAIASLDDHLHEVLDKLHREGGVVVADEFNLATIDDLVRVLRAQMDALGYREAIREQVVGLQQLAAEIEQEIRDLGGPHIETPEKFTAKSERAIELLLRGAESELTQVGNQAAEELGQLLRQAALGNVEYDSLMRDIRKKLEIKRNQADALITTTLHSFNSHIRVMQAREAGVEWFVYLGPNELRGQPGWQPDHVIREWCWHWEGRRGTLEMFEKTSDLWGREDQPAGVAAWRGGWRCRHQLVPLIGKANLEKWPVGPRT
jgi:hypothetical protein